MKTDRHVKDSTDKLYFSTRLHAKLEGMLTARTTIVSAPADYYKTTAVREFGGKRLRSAPVAPCTCPRRGKPPVHMRAAPLFAGESS